MTDRSAGVAPSTSVAIGAGGLAQAGWLNGANGAGPAGGRAPAPGWPAEAGDLPETARRQADGNSSDATGANCGAGLGQAGGSDSLGTSGGVQAGGGSVAAF